MNFLKLIYQVLKALYFSLIYGVFNIINERGDRKFFSYLNPFYFKFKKINHGKRIAMLLEAMGPIFIKFGQLLSTRTDIVTSDIIIELQNLTNNCAPFDTDKALSIIQKEIENKGSIDEFKEIKSKPMAAASLAQVHEAILNNDDEVVIKVLRPNINKKVKNNIAALKSIASILSLVIKESDRLKFNEIVQKYLGNVKPNYFYLNPITNKAEPILSGLSNFKSNKIKKLIIKSCETDTSYLTLFKNKKEEAVLRLKANKTVLNERVIIPKGFTIEINAGQEIDIINNGSILSYSPIKCKGTLNDKIKIYSSDSSGQGVHIIQNNEASFIEHLVFSNQTSFTYRTKIMSWTLPSALTFYGGEIKISNSHFKDLHSEDAINTFRSKYTFRNSIVENTFSDAFDADFGYGIVDSCNFINCGNDAVDISGGHLDLSNTYFTIVKDKAISAGEESEMNVSNCIIENTSLGIISKDLSKVSASNTTLSNCEIAYCAFQKKGEFGPATIIAKNSIESNCKKKGRKI